MEYIKVGVSAEISQRLRELAERQCQPLSRVTGDVLTKYCHLLSAMHAFQRLQGSVAIDESALLRETAARQ